MATGRHLEKWKNYDIYATALLILMKLGTVRGGNMLFPNDYGEDLFYLLYAFVSHPHTVFTPWDMMNIFISAKWRE